MNPFIVRVLDYYTKTVFEFVTTDLGSQGTVCGGGRYDELIKQLGGSSTPGVGFGMGLERVLMLMETKGVAIPREDPVKLYIASIGDEAYTKAFSIVSDLRRKGIKCECDHMRRSVKSQFKYADKIGAEYVLTIGENELKDGAATLKKMADGSEKRVSFDEISNEF